jgi:hypothetical protein
VSFKNAIIILTSNLGSAEIFNAAYKQKKEGGQVAGGFWWTVVGVLGVTCHVTAAVAALAAGCIQMLG